MNRQAIGRIFCELARWLGYEPPIKYVDRIVEKIVEVKPTPPLNYELPSPRATVKKENIIISDLQVCVRGILPPVTKFTVPNTNSMEQAIDENHWVIASAHPSYKENLEVGEVIVFNIKVVDYLTYAISDAEIIHAIVEIGEDEQGWYCKTKGWNPYLEVDNWLVRKEQISWICRMVCW